jgi:hypothetical protein
MTSGGSIAGSIRLSNASKLRVETVSTVNPIRFINLPPSRQSTISGTKNPAEGYFQCEFYPATTANFISADSAQAVLREGRCCVPTRRSGSSPRSRAVRAQRWDPPFKNIDK